MPNESKSLKAFLFSTAGLPSRRSSGSETAQVVEGSNLYIKVQCATTVYLLGVQTFGTKWRLQETWKIWTGIWTGQSLPHIIVKAMSKHRSLKCMDVFARQTLGETSKSYWRDGITCRIVKVRYETQRVSIVCSWGDGCTVLVITFASTQPVTLSPSDNLHMGFHVDHTYYKHSYKVLENHRKAYDIFYMHCVMCSQIP